MLKIARQGIATFDENARCLYNGPASRVMTWQNQDLGDRDPRSVPDSCPREDLGGWLKAVRPADGFAEVALARLAIRL
jgi:hypothetical protein